MVDLETSLKVFQILFFFISAHIPQIYPITTYHSKWVWSHPSKLPVQLWVTVVTSSHRWIGPAVPAEGRLDDWGVEDV